jgi:hypothetical protein
MRCGSHRATLEGSWQLSKLAIGSVTVGTDVLKGGIARGLALESQLTQDSKLLLRCLAEPSFGWQWLATWSQQLSRHHRLELQGVWHRPGDRHAAGFPSLLADRCSLSLHLVGTAQASGNAHTATDSASSTQSLQRAAHPSEACLQGDADSGDADADADGGKLHGYLDKRPQWSVVLSCDPRTPNLWGLHAQLH